MHSLPALMFFSARPLSIISQFYFSVQNLKQKKKKRKMNQNKKLPQQLHNSVLQTKEKVEHIYKSN